MGYKISVTKPGFDATTETNPNNINFSSDYNTLKYYASGGVSLTVNAGPLNYVVLGTLTHGLGYKPFFKVYADWIAYGPVGIFYNPTLDYSSFLGAAVDDTNIYFIASGFVDPFGAGTASFTANFKYKLFKNNIGL